MGLLQRYGQASLCWLITEYLFFFLTSGYNEGAAWTSDLEPILERLAERERVLKPPLESSEADGKCFCAVSDVGESEDMGSLLAFPLKGKKSGLVTGTLC